MVIHYKRNFNVGQDTHCIECYHSFSNESGLEGDVLEKRESPRMDECLKGLDINAAQKESVKQLMRQKRDGIILEDGKEPLSNYYYGYYG